MKLITSAILFFLLTESQAQNKYYDVTIKKANTVNFNPKFYTVINNTNKSRILLLSKYIDTTKAIYICGGITFVTTTRLIRGGAQIFGGFMDDVMHLKIFKNQLLVTSKINNIDGEFIAEIKDNKLISSLKNYNEYASSGFIEIYNEYHNPVFQVSLNKMDNSITVNGIFFFKQSCALLWGKEIKTVNYPAPFKQMSQTQRDSISNVINTLAMNHIKPIH